MENTKNSRAITLKELWDIFLQRLWLIILVGILVAGASFAAYHFTFVPMYESVSTLYVMRQSDDATAAEKIQEYNLAIWGINDYDYMLKSQKTLSAVGEELKKEGITTSYNALKASISVNNPENTRILEVRVVSDSAEHAKLTVDLICKIGVDTITTVMDSEDQITVFEQGTINTTPCNRRNPFTFVLLGIISAIAVYFIFVITYLLDDRIKSDEDIEEYLSLSVLGDIPEIGSINDKHYGYGERSKDNNSKKGGNK